MAATRIRRSPRRLAPSAPTNPSRETTPTPSMESPTPKTPQRVGRSRPSTKPRSRPHTGAVAKTRPVLAVLVRLTPKVKVVWDTEAAQPQHGEHVVTSQPALRLHQPQHEQEQQPPDGEPERDDQQLGEVPGGILRRRVVAAPENGGQ